MIALRVLVGLALLASLIALAGVQDIARVGSNLQWEWVLLAAACLTGSTLLGAVNLHLLLGVDNARTLSYSRFLPGFWLAWAIGLVVPGGIGDIASVSLWLKRHGFPLQAGLGRALLDKFISLVWMLLFALFGAILLYSSVDIPPLEKPWRLWWAAVLPVAVLVLFLRSPWGLRIGRFVSDTAKDINRVATRFPGTVFRNFLLTPAKIGLVGLSYWCMFVGLGKTGIDPPAVIALASLAGLAAYVPISFNGLGTVEAVGVIAFGAFNISADEVLFVYLVLRGVVLSLAGIPAAILLLAAPVSLRMGRKNRAPRWTE